MKIDYKKNKRRLKDQFICGFNNLYYSIFEPIKLIIARIKYSNQYSDQPEEPLVSIMIATYNRGQLLVERTLPSIIAQTYKNIEIVIVGDNCTDDTAILIKQFQINNPSVKFTNLPKRGKYPNDVKSRWFVAGVVPANKALTLIKGKWVGWVDDDDVLVDHHIESLLHFAQKGNYEFVAGLYEAEIYGERIVRGHKTSNNLEFGGHSTWLYRSYLKFFKYNINSWRKAWNKPADIDLQLRMLTSGVRMESLSKVVTYVLPRPDSTTIGLDAHLKNQQKS